MDWIARESRSSQESPSHPAGLLLTVEHQQWIVSRTTCQLSLLGSMQSTGLVRTTFRIAKRSAQTCLRCSAGVVGRRLLSSGAAVGAQQGYDTAAVRDQLRVPHPSNNVPDGIIDRVGRRLLDEPDHPLRSIARIVSDYWQSPDATIPCVDTDRPCSTSGKGRSLTLFQDLSPIVTVRQNFDDLLIPPTHVSRSPTDTFYLDDERLLRCHTSAHQTQLLRAGERGFLVAGDVYRRDTVDQTHYPVFHQMEGVRVFSEEELAAAGVDPEDGVAVTSAVEADLRAGLEGMARQLFGAGVEMRWVEAYFPFTEPSLELEVLHDGEWLEVLGCGKVHGGIMEQCGLGGRHGWAFGLGLDRLAMRLFSIPDIRLFWSRDERFLSQFQGREGDLGVRFEPFSKYPPCFKDITFWLPGQAVGPGEGSGGGEVDGDSDDLRSATTEFHAHSFFEVVREVAGDLAERVDLIDSFQHPKTGRLSHCYRVTYRSMERSLTNAEVDRLQNEVRDRTAGQLGAELR